MGVIGGGLNGLSCTKNLAEGGKEVVLLEARNLFQGAAGRNGGHLSPAGFWFLFLNIPKYGFKTSWQTYKFETECVNEIFNIVGENTEKVDLLPMDICQIFDSDPSHWINKWWWKMLKYPINLLTPIKIYHGVDSVKKEYLHLREDYKPDSFSMLMLKDQCYSMNPVKWAKL